MSSSGVKPSGLTHVTVLGGSGMLGAMVTDALARDPSLRVTATVRSQTLRDHGAAKVPEATWTIFDAAAFNGHDSTSVFQGQDYVINAIGIIKPYIHDDNPDEVRTAIQTNSLFPHRLASVAGREGFRVLQIATDCTFDGTKGGYVEGDAHNPTDVYGKTKSLGEVNADCMHHLRCSIVGPEVKGAASLLEWLVGQPEGAQFRGFSNHRWNGVTTLHFAKVCHGIVTGGLLTPRFQHLIPTGVVTKAELLRLFAQTYGRSSDLTISEAEAPVAIDRTLGTQAPESNDLLWQGAGYAEPPTVAAMIREMGAFDFRLGRAPAETIAGD